MIARELITLPAYTDEVVRGLTSRQKILPFKLLYDDRGSELFEAITQLPEYYLTRTELQILQERSTEIVQAVGTPISIVELGAGTASKTGTLLQAFSRRHMRLNYLPVDISGAALDDARRRITTECPNIAIRPVIADFGNGFHFLREISGRKLVLYLGSSIGNFDWQGAVDMLNRVREQLSTGDALLLGTDMAKDTNVLLPAYDDAQGVTSEFSKNILVRLNRELGANFDTDSFQHVAEWNQVCSRIEIYLESLISQHVAISLPRVSIYFSAGERIHTENSYKYTTEMVERLLCVSGFTLEKTWFDRRQWFGLHLASCKTK